MKRYLATFSGAKYHQTTQRIVEDAPKLGVDEVLCYDDHWLKTKRRRFCERTRWFFEQRHQNEDRPRGVNFFCWKPYVALDVLRRIDPGDVFLFLDADTYPIADLRPLYDQCVADGGVMAFGARGCLVRHWCKRDCLLLMNADHGEYLGSYQAVARFLLMRKPTGNGSLGGGPEFDSEGFLREWMAYTVNPIINTFEPSILGPEHDGFQQHRCEQAVLGILAIRHGLKLYREACGFGGWGTPADPNHESEWPGAQQLFVQHGGHSYRPGFSGDESEGSCFRNVLD